MQQKGVGRKWKADSVGSRHVAGRAFFAGVHKRARTAKGVFPAPLTASKDEQLGIPRLHCGSIGERQWIWMRFRRTYRCCWDTRFRWGLLYEDFCLALVDILDRVTYQTHIFGKRYF